MMLSALQQDSAGWLQRPVLRFHAGAGKASVDEIAEEVPVALIINGISHAVMMATPCDLEEFALGFALTEGIVATRASIYDIEVRYHRASVEVELTVSQPAFLLLKERRRSLAGRSGCGICGIESLALLDLTPQPLADPQLPSDLAKAILRAGAELAAHQRLMKVTGGVHAAAWCRLDGQVSAVYEDVGRHNALDKLIGHLAMHNVDMGAGFAFMSSRASYELVRKAARMRIPMLATISAPSTLAIDIALQAGMKLVSFCRHEGFVEYA